MVLFGTAHAIDRGIMTNTIEKTLIRTVTANQDGKTIIFELYSATCAGQTISEIWYNGKPQMSDSSVDAGQKRLDGMIAQMRSSGVTVSE